MILVVVVVVLPVAGMFVDAVAIRFVAPPILPPVARELGRDRVRFGAVATIDLAVGRFTPPWASTSAPPPTSPA